MASASAGSITQTSLPGSDMGTSDASRPLQLDVQVPSRTSAVSKGSWISSFHQSLLREPAASS